VRVSPQMFLCGMAEPGRRLRGRDPSEMPERGAAVAQVVRAEGGNAGRGACTGDRRPQSVCGRALENTPS